jgi:hypothetical protein
MNNYNIPFCEIETLSEINFGKYHYNYKTVDFMFNYKENSEKLLIVFHGRVHSNEKYPVFYKYNFERENTSVLSLSDRLLKNNRKIHNTFFLSSLKYNYQDVYIDIINYVLNSINCEKNIFFGTCSGSFPALYYGIIFKKYIFIANGFIEINCVAENLMIDVYKKNNLYDELVKINIFDTLKISQPKQIYLYINKHDSMTFEMNKIFILFCKKNYPDIITPVIHDTIIDNKDGHDIHFPNGENFDTVFDKI